MHRDLPVRAGPSCCGFQKKSAPHEDVMACTQEVHAVARPDESQGSKIGRLRSGADCPSGVTNFTLEHPAETTLDPTSLTSPHQRSKALGETGCETHAGGMMDG